MVVDGVEDLEEDLVEEGEVVYESFLYLEGMR